MTSLHVQTSLSWAPFHTDMQSNLPPRSLRVGGRAENIVDWKSDEKVVVHLPPPPSFLSCCYFLWQLICLLISLNTSVCRNPAKTTMWEVHRHWRLFSIQLKRLLFLKDENFWGDEDSSSMKLLPECFRDKDFGILTDVIAFTSTQKLALFLCVCFYLGWGSTLFWWE